MTYDQWHRVDCPDGKKRMKIVEKKLNKVEFFMLVHNQTTEFLEHVSRIKGQYKALKDLKDNLPKHHVIVQMDFAENCSCSSDDEVQSV